MTTTQRGWFNLLAGAIIVLAGWYVFTAVGLAWVAGLIGAVAVGVCLVQLVMRGR